MIADTSVLIRYLTNDDPVKAAKFDQLLLSKEPFFVTDVTFAETYWVLLRNYKQSRERILTLFESLLSIQSLFCNRQHISGTIALLKKHKTLSFVDAYTAVYSVLYNENIVLSYDKGFSKIEGIIRKEP